MQKKITMGLILLMIFSGCFIKAQENTKVQAASCSIKLSTEDTKQVVDKEFIVTLTITAKEPVSGVEMLLSYDEDALEFVEATPCITGEDGTLLLEDSDISDPQLKTTYLIKFKAEKTGTSYIKVMENPAVYNESAGATMSCASNVLAVDVKKTEKQSNNNNLKSLRIATGTLVPEFSNKVNEYTVVVPVETEKFIISATPIDSKATVDVVGNEHLTSTENTVKVITTAENGDTKEITILVKKDGKNSKEEESEEPKEETDEKDSELEGSGSKEEKAPEEEASKETEELKNIIAKRKDGVITISTWGEYEIQNPKSKNEIPQGYELSSILIGETTVPVYQKENNSELVLIYASHDGMEPEFYQYDTKEQTVSKLYPSTFDSPEIEQLRREYKEKEAKYQRNNLFLGMLSAILGTVVLVGVLVLHKQGKNRKQKDQ